MQNKKNENKQRIQIGTSSLLLIFTVLCLVVFGTLSLSSAKADYKLAIKNEKSIKNFYEADNSGEDSKRTINRKIISAAAETTDEGAFKKALKENMGNMYDESTGGIMYTIDAGKDQFLMVEMKVHDFSKIREDKINFDLNTWIIQNKVDYEIDESMNVWNGE